MHRCAFFRCASPCLPAATLHSIAGAKSSCPATLSLALDLTPSPLPHKSPGDPMRLAAPYAACAAAISPAKTATYQVGGIQIRGPVREQGRDWCDRPL